MRKLVALLVFGLLAGAVPAASAGGPTSPLLVSADPADGAKVDAAPDSITLTFSQPLDGAYSRIEVFDQCGKRADKGGDTVTVNQMSIALTRKPAGRYRVYYVANATPKGATGETSGFLSFTVAKGPRCKKG